MITVYRGRGFLVILLPMLGVLPCLALPRDEQDLGLTVGLAVAGALVWLLGWLWRPLHGDGTRSTGLYRFLDPGLVEAIAAKDLKVAVDAHQGHSVFFLSLELWGPAWIAVAGLVYLIGPCARWDIFSVAAT